MSLVINHNLMAMNASRNLGTHYGSLSTSVRRLSSGLRVETAADDAAGLAIRELMRADISTMNQGIRNANDAISMVQVADGALQVIDEKLIRMKELAEQASTGTYNSDQRLMIDSEFQAMKSEIYRIAQATDFNGVHLLDGTLSGTHDGSQLQSTGAAKIHFGTGNDPAEDYYYVEIPQVQDERINLGGTIENGLSTDPGQLFGRDWFLHQDNGSPAIFADMVDPYAITDDVDDFEVFYRISSARMGAGTENTPLVLRTDSANITSDFSGMQIGYDSATQNWTMLYSGDPGDPYFGSTVTNHADSSVSINLSTGGGIISGNFNLGVPASDTTVTFDLAAEYGIYDPSGSYPNATVEALSSGIGYANVRLDGSGERDFEVTIQGFDVLPTIQLHNAFIKVDLRSNYELREGALGLHDMNVRTQESAQQTLEDINDAIIAKDNIRANLGALQNRLENTVSNLAIQAENLQAAESRISDVDVATEMTEFVRGQILTQAATAMLAQANSLPRMALQLIGGG